MNKKTVDYSLYLVTDRGVLGGRDLLQSLAEALAGGVTVVQLREKNLDAKEFYLLAREAKKITERHGVPLIINDRLDIALAVDADGVHVGQQDLPAAAARKILGREKILGVSAANLAEALQAEKDGADYLGVGAIFPTTTKNDVQSLAPAELKEIKQLVKIPVVAIGGINENNIGIVTATGIDGVAVASAILGKDDIGQAARSLSRLVRQV